MHWCKVVRGLKYQRGMIQAVEVLECLSLNNRQRPTPGECPCFVVVAVRVRVVTTDPEIVGKYMLNVNFWTKSPCICSWQTQEHAMLSMLLYQNQFFL